MFMEFRTRESGVLLLHLFGVDTYADNFVTVEAKEFEVTLTFDLGTQGHAVWVGDNIDLMDSDWHNVSVGISRDRITMEVDGIHGNDTLINNSLSLGNVLENSNNIFVGGVDPSYRSSYAARFYALQNFKGCLERVRIGGILLPFFNQSDLANSSSAEQFYMDGATAVQSPGCFGDPVCDTDECENNATCQDIWNAYTCQCAPGFNGTYCDNNIDECQWSECENGATCIDGIANYTCDCAPGYTGWL